MGLHEPKTGLILTATGGFSWFSFSSLLFIVVDLSSHYLVLHSSCKTRGLSHAPWWQGTCFGTCAPEGGTGQDRGGFAIVESSVQRQCRQCTGGRRASGSEIRVGCRGPGER